MGVYWNFPSGWWVILAIIYGIYFLAYLSRKRKSFDLLFQLRFGLVILALGFLIEFVAVSLRLWNYIPGNWPVILWFGYFSVGLMAYRIIKKLDESRK